MGAVPGVERGIAGGRIEDAAIGGARRARRCGKRGLESRLGLGFALGLRRDQRGGEEEDEAQGHHSVWFALRSISSTALISLELIS